MVSCKLHHFRLVVSAMAIQQQKKRTTRLHSAKTQPSSSLVFIQPLSYLVPGTSFFCLSMIKTFGVNMIYINLYSTSICSDPLPLAFICCPTSSGLLAFQLLYCGSPPWPTQCQCISMSCRTFLLAPYILSNSYFSHTLSQSYWNSFQNDVAVVRMCMYSAYFNITLCPSPLVQVSIILQCHSTLHSVMTTVNIVTTYMYFQLCVTSDCLSELLIFFISLDSAAIKLSCMYMHTSAQCTSTPIGQEY